MDQKKSLKEEIITIEEKITKVNGDICIKQYQKGRLLGKGGFAKCFEVTNLENKKTLAAKIIPKATLTKTRARQKLISEIKIHKSLHNTNIVQFEHVFEDSENVYILLELCPNQTLNELIKRRKRLHELECMCYVSQILHALKYLHYNRVIHRDLKLGNLFLGDKMELKLGDFGLATKLEFDTEKKRTICGTPNYIAPEILDDKTGHSYPVDIWSLGVIIYTMIIGKPPFETPDVKTTYKKIRMNNYSFPEHVQIGESARSLIIAILQSDPSKRPNIEDIYNHPFLSSCQIPKLLPLSSLACVLSPKYIRQFQKTPAQQSQQENMQAQFKQFSKNLEQLEQQNSQQRNSVTNTGNGDKNKGMNNGMPSMSQTQFRGTQSIKQLNTNTFNNQMSTVQSVGTFNQNQVAQKSSKQREPNEPVSMDDVWVVQWVDYSSKYGLGYLLSNGYSGVYFNDSTKIILGNGDKFDYMQRISNQRQDTVQTFPMDKYPKELQKKVTLLTHFCTYLNGDHHTDNKPVIKPEDYTDTTVYVKKWMKTRHAIMFRLSNKVVQVNFTDKTEILLSSQKKEVTYVNKKSERLNYPLSSALETDNLEMAKRLKYTKEILTHMLNNNNKPGPLDNQQPTQQQQEQKV